MSDSAPSPDIDLSWRMREQESQLLATLVRSSRLTLLSAEPGLDRTGLLKGGLLPLLRRRAGDAVGEEDRESRVVIPFTDRRVRRVGRAAARVAERVVLFDAWGASPMTALRRTIVSSLPADAVTYARSARLAPMLGELTRRFDARFVVVLDRFEQFWHPALSLDDAEQFVDEFSEAVTLDGLRANFLLSIDDIGEPRLDALRRRIAGFDASTLHLLRWQSVSTQAAPLQKVVPAATPAAPALHVAGPAVDGLPNPPAGAALPVLQDAVEPMIRPPPAALAPATPLKKPRRPRPPRVPFVKPAPIDTEGVYAFIESTLSQTATDSAPWHDAEGTPAATPVPREVRAPPQQPVAGRRSLPDDRAWQRRSPGPSGRSADMTNSLLEPTSPIDKWLDAAFAWLRRRLPLK